MKGIIKKAGVLALIFVVAVVVYFIWHRGGEEDTNEIYTSLGEESLPLVYPEALGREMGVIYGYRQEMADSGSLSQITVLPSDRQLRIDVEERGDTVTGIRYEIRSLDGERLVERTEVEEWDRREDGSLSMILPIQNLLEQDKQYTLSLILNTKENGEVRYYTRIILTDEQIPKQMVDLAVDFSGKTFDYNQARELVTYLESNDSADNTTLGTVTIESSFDQLTWGGLKFEPVGAADVYLKELDGIMGNVELTYLVKRSLEDGEEEIYEIKENFTMKWNSRRIYLMDYERKMDQIFSGDSGLFSGKRILTGITNDDRMQVEKDESSRYTAFVANRDLWMFDQNEHQAVKIFSFRTGESLENISCGRHNIRIVSVRENGNVDFLVYGYMNRGTHEGMMGAAFYRYDRDADVVEEKFFFPVDSSFEKLEQDVKRLSYLGDNDMFYIMVDHSVYGIDLKSNEYMVVADRMEDGTFTVNEDGSHLAWQEGEDKYGGDVIHVMNLKNGQKQDIPAGSGEALRVLGFVGSDFMYGKAHKDDVWIDHGRVTDLPMYMLEIVDDGLNVETHYEKEGYYISDVTVEDSRIHLNNLAKTGENSYAAAGNDIIVCNADIGPSTLEGIGWYASEDRQKLYFVQLDSQINRNSRVRINTPKEIIYDKAGILDLKAGSWTMAMEFYAYGNGRLLGTSQSLSSAISMAYEEMGYVADENGRMLWNRVSRPDIASISNPESAARGLIEHLEEMEGNKEYEDGLLMLDARRCTLHQMLYYIGRGCPVIAYLENGQYVLLYGYDQYNVSIYYPESQTTEKMGLNDGENFFQSQKNDFVCGILTD